MRPRELLARLRAAGIELWADGEHLRYRAPTGALTAELREELTSQKAALLAWLKGATTHALRPAPGAARGGPVPLSHAQQSLWFLHELYPESTAANEQFAIRLDGALETQPLIRAWQTLLQRHEILHSCFAEDEGEVRQVLVPPVAGMLPIVDLSGLPEPERDLRLRQAAEHALAIPFDPGAAPLIRAQLFRLARARHVLLVTAHHMIADGLSVPVLRGELARLYGALAADEPMPPPPALQYADLSLWQRTAPVMHERAQLEFWRSRLAELPVEVLRPLQHAPRAPGAVGPSQRLGFEIAPATADGLRALARRNGATSFMVLLAAFRALLSRYTGAQDLVIGTPVTGRESPALRDLVGCLVNPVALRSSTAGDPSFRELLERERATALAAFQHRHLPFARVVEAANPGRSYGAHPLFQILFTYEAVPDAAQRAGGVSFSPLSILASRQSYFELECALSDAGEGAALKGYLAYASDCLEEFLAASLARHYGRLLEAVVRDPDCRLSALDFLAPAERDWLAGVGRFLVANTADGTLHGMVLEQARRTPDAIAIVAAARQLSYAELDRRSAALAAHLADLGVVAGSRVGVAVGRSPELVVTVLAVLRAGGIIVPLDPAYPPARLRLILEDADVALVVTEQRFAAALPLAGLMAFTLDRFDWGRETAGPCEVAVGADDAAYLLYTSGSTGQPKGAIGLHRGAVNRCRWFWDAAGFSAQDVFAQRTSLNFVDSLWEIFGALGNGVRLVVIPDAHASDPQHIAAAVERHGITHIVLVPSLLNALLEAVEALPGLAALRSVITSGEPLEPALARRFAAWLPRARLLNTYGTSEIWDATWFDLGELSPEARRVPIGRPLANVRPYVLDAQLQLLPAGVPGELCVGGVGVGAGYWRRPDLTAERFVPDPFAAAADARIYRTGDLARLLPGGNIECLGRLDRQVKLRGFRVELAEVERALLDCAGVRQAAAVLQPGPGGDARLVAFVVPSDGPFVSPATLRDELRQRLPDYMVPATMTSLDSLPLTPSGKLDRAALPNAVVSQAEPTPPRTPVERALAVAWCELLERPAVGTGENFFELGGHSLLAIRLLTRLRSEFRVPLALRDVFEARDLAELAATVEALAWAGEGGAAPAGDDREEIEI